ncbi:hypothetical protein BDZ89DRAFT_1069890 [Hymenopellis radicata]|nr:hypothetical protein BDZ89DRAFT_1069890 [Hymenopellis radicata]
MTMARLYPVHEVPEDLDQDAVYGHDAYESYLYASQVPSPSHRPGNARRSPSWSYSSESSYSKFQQLYRQKVEANVDSGVMQDNAENDEEEDIKPTALLGDSDIPQPTDAESKARLEWQLLFASVLSGDVLKSEKTRIQRVLESSANKENDTKLNIWLGLRAKFHAKTLEEERKSVEERRVRFIDDIIKEVLTFHVDHTIEKTPLQQVTDLLSRLDIAQSLYPSLARFYSEKPAALDAQFQVRWDALNTYFTVVTRLQDQMTLLQRWTGSETLDVNQPNTSAEQPIGVNGHSPDKVDGSTFVERLMKEESMQRTFEKGFLGTVHEFIGDVRTAQVSFAPYFEPMGLPTFENEVTPLISFPTKLAQACLHLRMSNINSLKNPTIMIVDQMTEDLRLTLGLACTLKRQYEAFLSPDPSGRWSLPQCISPDYEDSILEALNMFFRLINWNHFKETDILEAQWPTLIDVSMTVTGGSARVAEHLCSLIQRIVVRVINIFDTQVSNPYADKGHHHKEVSNFEPNGSKPNGSETNGLSDEEQAAEWYGKILDNVRLRYRKIQRYARMLSQRFMNAAEYSLESNVVKPLFQHFCDCGFVLVYTEQFESDGVYVLASPNLYGKDAIISRKEKKRGENDCPAQFVLFLSPLEAFHWTGAIRSVYVPPMNVELADNRIRIVADGGSRRLALAKEAFASYFARRNEAGTEVEKPIIPFDCIADARANYPKVDALLVKMNRTTHRLADSIVSSVHQVQKRITMTEGRMELMQNWYLFAAEHGQHAQRTMEKSVPTGFNRALIQLAIAWLTFICEDCNPNDQKTFRWAVNALEFTFQCTVRSILNLPQEQFVILRQGVAQCMTLLTGHFDILGARSNVLEKERQELLAKQKVPVAPIDGFFETYSQDSNLGIVDDGTRRFWERAVQSLQQVEADRQLVGSGFRIVGRVLDDEKPEDRSLVFLANSSSNIAINWQQGKFIGAGAFGSVFLALNMDSGSVMAVKEIKCQEVSGMHNLYSQIKDELSVMEMLRHPNIVEYYGIEVHRDKVYIFEEFCEGGSLASLLEHGRIEDEEAVQYYTMQMLEGLIYLHSQNVVHRDIKPDNILLDHNGIIKFVDFGAAKIIAKNQQRNTTRRVPEMTKTGDGFNNHLTGTPSYMSPEVIKNDRRGRHGAMDIWSLGCVVLECATGKKPWSNLDNEWAIMYHIGVATQHPPLPDKDQLCLMGIDFIKDCLTIDAMKRPTATELMEHVWMLDLREKFKRYEEEEQLLPPSEPKFGEGAIAIQARMLEEKENLMSPDATPSSVGDTPLLTLLQAMFACLMYSV